ncbi:Uncharacterised protein [Klebsiella aerogenes]|nr:Uncharacterised protein [Klebsiella aerogenes]
MRFNTKEGGAYLTVKYFLYVIANCFYTLVTIKMIFLSVI